MARCLLLCLLCWPLWLQAAGPPSEAAVKAALVTNLVSYTEWPEASWSAKHSLICVAGRGAVVDSLMDLDAQTRLGHRIGISVRHAPAEARDCQVLFIGDAPVRGQGEWLQEWTQLLSALPILTVCEGDEFVSHGCMIGLSREGTQVAFSVNLAAVRRANLRLSAHLLRLARTVYGRP